MTMSIARIKESNSSNLLQKVIHKVQWEFFRQEGRRKLSDKVQVYVVSHPKCGRTWLRMLLGKVLCEKFNLDKKYILNTIKLTLMAGTPTVNWIHDGSGSWSPGSRTGSRFVRLVADKSIFQDKKVIFLCREPKDVMVSSYFHTTKRQGYYFKGGISEFIRTREHGIEKLVDFYKLWHKNKSVPKDFLLIKYEDLQANPHQILKTVLDFIGIQEVEAEIVDRAVEFASFNNMKKLEKSKATKYKVLQPGDENDTESYKVRKGKVGGYTEYLSQADIEYIDRTIARKQCPFYGNDDRQQYP